MFVWLYIMIMIIMIYSVNIALNDACLILKRFVVCMRRVLGENGLAYIWPRVFCLPLDLLLGNKCKS